MCRYEFKRYSLKIDPVYRNDSGRYACLAKNEFGHAWLNFTITVTGTRQMLISLLYILYRFSAFHRRPQDFFPVVGKLAVWGRGQVPQRDPRMEPQS